MKSSCISNLPNDRFVVIRQSWVSICRDNHCAAALLNFFVSWHDWKIENQPRSQRENTVALNHGVESSLHTSLIQHHSLAELKQGLCGLYSEKTIQKAIAVLVNLGFVQPSRNPDPRYKFDRTTHYLVVIDLIKSALHALGNFTESMLTSKQNSRIDGLIDSVKIPDGEVKIPDGEVKVSNHYQDTNQDNYQHPTNTHEDPERVCENSEPEILTSDPDPDLMPTSPDRSTVNQSIPLQQSESRGEDLSGACHTTLVPTITPTGYLAKTEKRYNTVLSRSELSEITQELIDIYNKVKPSCWGTCTQITAYLTKQVSTLLEIYQQDLDLPASIESLKNDIAGAHLSCKGDDFYDKSTFGIPSIAFFLDPKRIDKLRNRAQVWYDRPQQQKEQLAKKMVAAVGGIPRWENPDVVLSGAALHLRRDRYQRYIKAQEFNRADCPSIEYLQTYFPELFKENA